MLLRSVLALIAGILLQSVVPPQAVAAPEPMISCAVEPMDTPVAYGDKIQCDLSASTDLDLFRFAGASGERVQITVYRTDGGNVCISLRRSNGTSVGNSSCTDVRFGQNTVSIDATLDETSMHTIVVSGDAVTYKLALDRAVPLPTYATSICNGCEVTDDLDPHPDLDFVSFDATPGSRVQVRVSRLGGGNVCINLRRPNGDSLGNTCTDARFGQNTVAIETTLDDGGTYVILLYGETVPYQLSLQCITGMCGQAPPCNGKTATLWGTDGDNFLVGTEGRDVIVGGGGNDIIYGLGGNDIICGDAGNDTIFGGEGNDKLFGGRGSDMLFGDGGDDRLTASSGDDLLFGGSGDDILKGGSDRDVCEGETHVFGDTADNDCEVKAGVAP